MAAAGAGERTAHGGDQAGFGGKELGGVQILRAGITAGEENGAIQQNGGGKAGTGGGEDGTGGDGTIGGVEDVGGGEDAGTIRTAHEEDGTIGK